MGVTFLEPGGDADFAIATTNGFWTGSAGPPTIATDFVHGAHQKSIKYAVNNQNLTFGPAGVLNDTGSRISFYFFINALPNATHTFLLIGTSALANVLRLRLTSTGILQVFEASIQIGTNGSTLATGQWYRISIAYTLTSTTVNRIEVFKDGVSDISITNATLTRVGSSEGSIGGIGSNPTYDYRTSDHFIDDSSSLTDTGDVWVTVKRPFSNGSANNFATQIGSGGSSYGTGHAPQVNERALSKTNGWSMIGAGSAVTEEYTVEAANVGDMDISGKTIIDWLGWISADATVGETASIVAGGVSSSYTTPVATRLVTKLVGSTSYPGGGTDVGIISDTSLTTLNLYECGVIIAFLGPASAPVTSTVKVRPNLLTLGVG